VTPWGRGLSFVSFRDRSAVYGLGFCAYDRQSLGRCSLPSRDMLELRQPLTNLEKALPTARGAFAAGIVRACELATVIVVCLACACLGAPSGPQRAEEPDAAEHTNHEWTIPRHREERHLRGSAMAPIGKPTASNGALARRGTGG